MMIRGAAGGGEGLTAAGGAAVDNAFLEEVDGRFVCHDERVD
jgi:hypothetical protein